MILGQLSHSVVSDSLEPMNLSILGLPIHNQFLESTQTHVHWVGDAIQPLILCHPLLLLPSIFPSIRVFSNESVLHIRWPKYWSFSFNINPSNEHPGLISFRMDWLDLLAVCLVKAMVFPAVMYGSESWTIKKADRWRIDAFDLWCWRKLLRVPWTARRSNQSILKEMSPGCSLEGLMLKL